MSLSAPRRLTWGAFLTSAPNGDMLLTSGPGRFTTGKALRYQLNKGLGGTESWSGRFGRREKLIAPTEFAIRTFQPVAQLLHRLRYPGSKTGIRIFQKFRGIRMCVPQLHWYWPTVDGNTCFRLLLFSIWSRYLVAQISTESHNPDENLFLTKLCWVQKCITFKE